MDENKNHRQVASQNLSSLGKRFFNYIEFDPDEELVYEIRKHPFGLFLIEASGFLISSIITALVIGLAYMMNSADLIQDQAMVSRIQPIMIIIGLILGIIGISATFLAGWVYKNNVIFVTNEKIAQVLYTNLVDRKVSQLSIGDVQDVTVYQKGLFPRIFKYGTMVIETAGEQQNYTFTYVPEPYECSQAIVGAHELNLRRYGN